MISTSEEQTYTFAKELAAGLQLPAHILLYGDLGAGKTLFSKGLADGFGVADVDEVTSPTFTLINQYAGRARIYHVDLYRLEEGATAAHAVDLDELLTDEKAVLVIEWAERLGHYPLPEPVWRISIVGDGSEARRITIGVGQASACRLDE